MRETLFFFKTVCSRLLSTVTVTPSDSDYVNRSACFNGFSQNPEIVHHDTLLLQEYGVSKKWVIIMDRRQDSNAAYSSRNKWTVGLGSLLCQKFRRNREETARKRTWEKIKDKSSNCDVYVTWDDKRCFL